MVVALLSVVWIRLLPLLVTLAPSMVLADGDFKILEEGLRPPDAVYKSPRAEPSTPSTASHSWRDEGSARQLRGLVCVQHIFVDDATTEWTESRRERAREQARLGLDRLKTLAAERDIRLRFRERESRYKSARDISAELDDHDWTTSAVRGASTRLGLYLPIAHCVAEECGEHLALLHVAKAGRSYAQPSLVLSDGEVERAVMFMRNIGVAPNLPEHDRRQAELVIPERPAAFMHEVLHLFGAEDMYQPESRQRAAKKLYPHDVMLYSHGSLEDLTVGSYTAYSVGWSESPPPPLPPQ